MDEIQELEVFIKALDFAEAAGGAEWLQPARTERISPPTRPVVAQGTTPRQPASEPPTADATAEDAPIFARRREGQPQPMPAAVPVEESVAVPTGSDGNGRGYLFWSAVAAASVFMMTTLGLSVAVMTRQEEPSPGISTTARVSHRVVPTSPVTFLRNDLPNTPVRPWAASDLHDAARSGDVPITDDAGHERLKDDLRGTLRRNGYLPSTYSLPSLPPSEDGRTLAPAVRFASANAN